MDIFLKADSETSLAATALLDRNAIASNPEAQARLDALLKPVVGKPAFIDLVERLSLTGFEKEMLDFILAQPDAPRVDHGGEVASQRIGMAPPPLLEKSDAKSAIALVNRAGPGG